MAKGQSLQDPFLNALRKDRVPVSIYLVNGIKRHFHRGAGAQRPLQLRSWIRRRPGRPRRRAGARQRLSVAPARAPL